MQLRRLAAQLLQKRDEAIEGRAASGVERRWREDEEAFDGLDAATKAGMIDYATGEAVRTMTSMEPKRSKVIVNVIRGKCESTEGRFSDALLPVDDRNWGLKTTPVPELAKAAKDDEVLTQNGQPLQNKQGGPLTVADLARNELERAEEKMLAMELEIEDQLTECGFNGECRKVAADAVRGGTGILKGPNVVKRVRKAWIPQSNGQTTVHVMQAVEEFKPASKRVDYWNVYPDPNCGEDPQKGAYVWERDSVLPREIRSLIGLPGYFSQEIIQVLDEEPNRTTVVTLKSGQQQVQINQIGKGSAYERWEYYGDLSREDMEALGCDCSAQGNAKTVSACVVFINDRPIKVQLNVLDSGGLPFDFFQWTTVSNSCWGIGIPRMELWPARVITAGWRAMMDNAGDSSGANVVLGADIEPDDGITEITGKKVWRAGVDVDDVSKQFAQFQIANNQKDLQAIIELALRFADLESSVPSLFAGEKGDLPDTLGATNIMVDSANVALRIRVKRWDDQITRPHLTRYYDWNMQYNPKPEIKGDFCVDPRGTSVLLMRDQQAPVLAQLLQMKGNPDVDLYTDWKKVIEQLYRAHHIDALKSEDEIKKLEEQRAKAGPMPMPQVEVAKIRADSDQKIAQLENQTMQTRIKVDTDRDTVFSNAEAQKNKQDSELRMMELQVKKEIELLKYSTAQKISLEDAKVALARDTMKLNVQKELAAASMAMDNHKTYNPPQVATPAIEPAKKAPAGQAFQR